MTTATMTTATMPEHVTRNELETRMDFRDRITDTKIEALRELIDSRVSLMQATVERGISDHKAIASEMRSEISEIRTEVSDLRGEVKALDARLSAFETKFGWYLTLFGVGITLALGIVQSLMK